MSIRLGPRKRELLVALRDALKGLPGAHPVTTTADVRRASGWAQRHESKISDHLLALAEGGLVTHDRVSGRHQWGLSDLGAAEIAARGL